MKKALKEKEKLGKERNKWSIWEANCKLSPLLETEVCKLTGAKTFIRGHL